MPSNPSRRTLSWSWDAGGAGSAGGADGASRVYIFRSRQKAEETAPTTCAMAEAKTKTTMMTMMIISKMMKKMMMEGY